MSIKLDLHVHSESRGRIFIGAQDLRKSLKRSNLDGVAITNFYNISHALWLKEKIKEYIIIVGQEIWTRDGHIIGLGLKKKINDFQSVEETIGQIHEQGGIVVVVHPFFISGISKKVKRLTRLPIDAIEVYNAGLGMFFTQSYSAKRLAQIMNVTQLASSDTTDPILIGRSYTEIMIDDSKSILQSIRCANVRLFKRALPIPFAFIFKGFLKIKDLEPCAIHAVPCYICGKSMAVRLFRERFECLDCGKKEFSRVVCCNGHYLCLECSLKRGAAVCENLQITDK